MQSPYSGLPPEAFWRAGVVDAGGAPSNVYVRKWALEPTDRIATAGSCFAQHIGRNLRKHGFGILDLEPAPASLDPARHTAFGFGMYSARYGNIYTARQLLQLAREALGIESPAEVVWTTDAGRCFDALRPGVEPDGLGSADEVLAHRAQHLKAVRTLLETADVFIFTMGLTEAWRHRQHGTVYPTAPGTIAGTFDAERYVFHNFNYEEVRADMQAFFSLVDDLRGRGRVRYLLTVSPVPLTATASGQHVMVATTYSKAVLRAVAGQFAAEREEVDYFPSFEIISNPWSPQSNYEANLRSVRADGVAHVMGIFAHAHLGDGASASSAAPAARQHVPEPDDELQCEEALLDAFATKR